MFFLLKICIRNVNVVSLQVVGWIPGNVVVFCMSVVVFLIGSISISMDSINRSMFFSVLFLNGSIGSVLGR